MMKKILKIINLITAYFPLLFFFSYICLLLWQDLGHTVDVLSLRTKDDIEYIITLLAFNFMAYSAFFAIPIAIILVCIRFFLLKDKISLRLIIFIAIETILLAMILFDFCNMYTYVFGD